MKREVSSLLDRLPERAAIDEVLGKARAGTSGALMLLGDPGTGKTALLDYALKSAADCRIVRAFGVESEMDMAYASLHQLCAPLLGGLARLPDPQQVAVAAAFGLRDEAGAAPDPFFVGLGVLGLLAEAAVQSPVVCLVDDVQWFDRASVRALTIAARRLQEDAVALLLAGRHRGDLGDLPGLTELRVAGLPDADARSLLASVLPPWVTEDSIDRMVAETAGNPLALLELPRAMTPAEMASGFGLPDASGLPSRIEESFLRRMERLPDDARRLVLLAAADPTGDAALLWRACELGGIDAGVAASVEDVRLLRLGSRVRFLHPLVRSAVYGAASADERRAAHGLLGEATDAGTDPDRRAWHRAQATPGPDEDVATELERSAQRARARGGVAAAAAFLERAVTLTADPGRRSSRALAAARAWHEVGSYDVALDLLGIAEAGPLTELERAQAEWLRARIIHIRSDGEDGTAQLLRAAQRLQPLDPQLARATYVDALNAATATDPTPEVGRALLARPQSEPPDPTDLLLRGYGVLYTEGFPHGTEVMAQALSAFAAAPFTGDDSVEILELAANIARGMWDDTAYDILTARAVWIAREAGALGVLPNLLEQRADYCADAGDLTGAAEAFDEAEAIRVTLGLAHVVGDRGVLAALRDEEDAVTSKIERLSQEWDSPVVAARLDCSLATLYNGLARHAEAFVAARRSCERHPAGGIGQAVAELVESAARSGQLEAGRAARAALTARTRLASTDWGLGVEASLAALLTEGKAAEELYREAVDRLTRMRLPLARAHLLYGEWLRRERRRADAREQLRTAHGLFEAMGARSFAERARRELAATGITVHTRRNAMLDELTPQEARIAVLAAGGLSDREIAGRLYISASTVDYHLRKVFRKLGISSRSQLHLRLTSLVRVERQGPAQRRPGRDPQLREDPVQVGADGPGRQEQVSGDLLVAEARGGQAGDLELLRGQGPVIIGLPGRPDLASGAQFGAGAIRPRRGAEPPELFEGRVEVNARLGHRPHAPQALAEQQVHAGTVEWPASGILDCQRLIEQSRCLAVRCGHRACSGRQQRRPS
jgi:DNA-binding CsgD family transcriptional regulator